MADRVRVNNLGMAIVLLSQGVPFFHAGDDILRSKSLTAIVSTLGDWFNRIDFTYQQQLGGRSAARLYRQRRQLAGDATPARRSQLGAGINGHLERPCVFP
jgi:hypothetical protein